MPESSLGNTPVAVADTPDAIKLLLSAIPKVFTVVTSSRRKNIPVKLVDFDLGSLETDYPEINHILCSPLLPDQPLTRRRQTKRPEKTTINAIPWEVIEHVDWKGGIIEVNKLEGVQVFKDKDVAQSVLLIRDILDAYVIDLQNRRLTRANDLVLEFNHGLKLIAADTGARALLRRLTGGLYHGSSEAELQDWKYVEFLRGNPAAVGAGARYYHRIEHLPPGEIASLAGALPYLHAAELILLLPHKLASDTLELMSPERQLQVFEELDDSVGLSILENMAPNLAADLIGRLNQDQAKYILDHLSKSHSERLVALLRFPENSVGGIMTNDMLAVPGNLTVAEARERLRTKLQEPDFIYFIYVVDTDEDMILRGVVTLRNILMARDDQCLDEIMNRYLETLDPLDSPRHAAYQLIKSQLAALPVTSPSGRLLGVVTVDSAVILVAPGAWSSQAPRIFS